jgi:hypothetical protein
MRIDRLLVLMLAAFAFCAATTLEAQAQSNDKPAKAAAQRCLRAPDGSCTKKTASTRAGQRAQTVSSGRVSYEGTPTEANGGPFFPFARFFQDNPFLFGLPTATCTTCNVVRRTK